METALLLSYTLLSRSPAAAQALVPTVSNDVRPGLLAGGKPGLALGGGTPLMRFITQVLACPGELKPQEGGAGTVMRNILLPTLTHTPFTRATIRKASN